MKTVIFRYGIYATLAIVILSALQFFWLMPNVGDEWAEIGGYLTMVLSMIFVFMGIRQYRDKVNAGRLSFGEGLKTGTLIALLPAVAFGLFDILYTEVLNPGWVTDYYNNYAEKLKKTVPPEQLQAKLDKLASQQALFENPVWQFLLMGGTVFVIGLIVAIISTLALRRNKPAAA